MKIRSSILFAYDSRVFEKYAKQSKFFSGVEESVDGRGSYFVDGNRENEIRERIIRNQEGDKVSLFQRGMDFVGRRVFESRYEKENEKDRECWWKKKEIEKIAAQI